MTAPKKRPYKQTPADVQSLVAFMFLEYHGSEDDDKNLTLGDLASMFRMQDRSRVRKSVTRELRRRNREEWCRIDSDDVEEKPDVDCSSVSRDLLQLHRRKFYGDPKENQILQVLASDLVHQKNVELKQSILKDQISANENVNASLRALERDTAALQKSEVLDGPLESVTSLRAKYSEMLGEQGSKNFRRAGK